MSLSKTSTTKDYSKPTRIKNLCSGWWKKPKEIRNVKTIWRQNNKKFKKSFQTKKEGIKDRINDINSDRIKDI